MTTTARGSCKTRATGPWAPTAAVGCFNQQLRPNSRTARNPLPRIEERYITLVSPLVVAPSRVFFVLFFVFFFFPLFRSVSRLGSLDDFRDVPALSRHYVSARASVSSFAFGVHKRERRKTNENSSNPLSFEIFRTTAVTKIYIRSNGKNGSIFLFIVKLIFMWFLEAGSRTPRTIPTMLLRKVAEYRVQ